MKNFGRVLRLTLQYRVTLMASVLCALAVGVLWGGNVTVIYPIAEIAFRGDSLHGWIDDKVQKSEQDVAHWRGEVERLERELGDAPQERQRAAASKLSWAQSRLDAEERALYWHCELKPYVKTYLPDSPFLTVVLIIGVSLLGTFFKNLFLMAHTVLVAKLTYRTTFELQNTFLARTLRMDVATFNNEGTSDLLSRFTYDMQNLASSLNSLFGKMVREPLKMAACLIGAGFICWRLLVFSLIVVPPAALLIRWLAKKLKRANRKAMEEMAQLYNTLTETFQGIKVVKAFTMERQERWRFHKTSKEYFKKSMRIARYDSMTHPITEVVGILIISLAILAGCYLVLENQTSLLGIPMSDRPLSMAWLTLFYGLLAGAADPARKLSEIFSQLQSGVAAADRIYALLDREPVVRDPECPRALQRHRQDLVFDNVEFSYQSGRSILRNIDLSIRFGETIAIVGPSGCGKTTLANLVPRFADPTGGRILLDGIPLTDVRLHDLRSQVGLVTQDPLLFDDTVFNNIRYGSPNATAEEVIDAARQAHAHAFIERELRDGYQTEVGPLGGLLSGGQRQRIALARAILRNPSILILDEATSQVDLESEQVIQRVLEHFVRGRTTIIITHRLGVLSLADRVVVMQDGVMVDVGTHNELLARCEFYRRLYQIQFEDLKQSA